MTERQSWDAARYDTQFGYVSRLGGGLVELADVQPGERVLDLGCGSGTILATFQAFGARVSGIDGDPAMVEAARGLCPDAEIAVGDGQDFRVSEPVDVVFSNAALHWMPRADDVARCVFDALRPGGRFVAEMGGAGNCTTIVDAVRAEGRARGVRVRAPWYFPTVAEQAAVLERTGFWVTSVEHFERDTPLEGPDGVADWLRMFGETLLSGFEESERETVIFASQERTRTKLQRDDGWIADYRRLRFRAIKPR